MGNPLELLDEMNSLGFLSDAQRDSLRAEWSSDGDLSSAAAAERLVKRALLTPYQADQLLAGDGQSIVVDRRFEVRERLGAGGMGEVFLARDRELGREVALKMLSRQLVCDEGAVARFKREAKAMARLAHPNIVQAYDAGTVGDQHFLVMEYVAGTDVAHLLKQGPIESSTAADYAYQSALALEHAHGKGIVHRDFKPSNLLITQHNQVKVLDLGLARFIRDQIADETLTTEGSGLGTPDYMSPEQFTGAKDADARSDVYSLGCSLYHMLTGRVPFPGSSLSQKRQAHLKSTPEPVQAHNPHVPAGLSATVSKMMAKRPVDRFQSAGECAEALLPYVAASSPSLPDMNSTATWNGSQLNIITAKKRRRRNLKWAGLTAALVLLSTAAGFGISQWWPRGTRANAAPVGPVVAKSTPAQADPKPAEIAQPAAIDTDPWVLTVSQDPNDGGKYRAISDALKDVKPGMTVRVLDGKTYKEGLLLSDAGRYAGITLEAVAEATILNEKDGVTMITLFDVPDVTIRGFQLQATGAGQPLVVLQGRCGGAVLERLSLRAELGLHVNGIGFDRCVLGEQDRPIIVQGCQFTNLKEALFVAHSSRIVIRNNVIQRTELAGFDLHGELRDIQIVGNRFEQSNSDALRLLLLDDGSRGILIANNSFLLDAKALTVVDNRILKGVVRIQNNLTLTTSATDFAFLHSNNPELPGNVPGDVMGLSKSLTFAHNWRETKQPSTDKSWIPPSESDVIADTIEGINRDSKSPDYLRPAADSPLATQGAGNTEPSLPRYVGALPPPGTDAWDWDRTWLAPPGTSALLTVSQDPANGGTYRTITDALKNAKPWATIRLLDDGSYDESIELNDPEQQRGIVLETAMGASIRSARVTDVPFFVLRGFRVRFHSEQSDTLVHLSGAVEGGLVESLEIPDLPNLPARVINGIVVQHVPIARDRPPLVIRRCRINGQHGNVRAIGVSGGMDTGEATSNVCVRDNLIEKVGEGIQLDGNLQNIQIVGNLILSCSSGGLNPENFAASSRQVLFANNTVKRCNAGFQYDDNEPIDGLQEDQTELSGNLLLEAQSGDVVRTVVSRTDGYQPVIDTEMIDTWRIRSNWRDLSGSSSIILPLVDGAFYKLPPSSFVSTDSRDPNYMHPKKDSPLATGGAGGDLPTYAGAIPPEGVEPWDWDITWRSRANARRIQTD